MGKELQQEIPQELKIPRVEIFKGIKFENEFTGKDLSQDEDFKRDVYNILKRFH